jgi:hypothetical protein
VVNPARVITDLHEESQRRSDKFTGKENFEIVDIDKQQTQTTENENEAQASLFQIVESAYLHVVQGRKDQSIILR